MEMVFFWVVLSGLAGYYASTLNRSGFGYFFLSLIISPLLVFIFLMISKENVKHAKVQDNDTKIYGRYRVEIESDYDKSLEKALNFYEDYNLKPSQYNTDDDYEKKFKNNKDEYFVINKVNGNVVLETYNLPKFKDIEPIEKQPTKSNIDDLVKLSELLEKNLLTKEEFEAQKAKLLNA